MWSLRPSIRTATTSAFLAGFVFLLSGCDYLTLKKEVKMLDEAGHLYGIVSDESEQEKPIIILLYQVLPDRKKLISYTIIHNSRDFHFVTMPGQYVISAFRDTNEDLVYQDDEFAGYYGAPSVITLEPGKNVKGLNVVLQPPQSLSLKESPNLSHPDLKAAQGLPHAKAKIGEVVDLDDGRFTHENGKLGLWQPLRFWETVGGGIFFLEPFSQDKIPVLFVHGAAGQPQDWGPIIQELDRSRFQPWVVFYPSGFRLNWIVEGVGKLLGEVFVTYKFEKLIVIAHSMGGMISRSLINHIVETDTRQNANILFITISTPWGGHQAAQFGVDYAPAVIPSWIDMVPNSPFQQALFQTPWPDTIKFYLLFGFKGGRNPFTNGNDDGTVSLVSQLRPEAQQAAIKSFGFNEDHTSILKSPQVSKKIRQILLTF